MEKRCVRGTAGAWVSDHTAARQRTEETSPPPAAAPLPLTGEVKTGDGGRTVPAPTETEDGEMPRVVGPSAEFVPELA